VKLDQWPKVSINHTGNPAAAAVVVTSTQNLSEAYCDSSNPACLSNRCRVLVTLVMTMDGICLLEKEVQQEHCHQQSRDNVQRHGMGKWKTLY